MSRIVAIHQPNFFPWLGYFDKIARSDVFVFLDDVQFPKTGGLWSNRVKMLVAGEARWITAPIHRTFHGFALTNEIRLNDEKPWRNKLLKTLNANYAKAPHYHETMDWLKPLILFPESNLANYNMLVIRTIAERIGLRHDHFVVSSSLGATGQATELLIDLTKRVGGDCYLCGGGAQGYQDDQAFIATGLELLYQSFNSPIYVQGANNEFSSGLSIIDALMNVGREDVRRLIVCDDL